MKDIYITWNRAVQLSIEYSTLSSVTKGGDGDGGWQSLVRMLTSLQQFANSLPAPLKPRARELVDPGLVAVIQARALGRTFSQRQRCDVLNSTEEDRAVAKELRLGMHASRATNGLEWPISFVAATEQEEDEVLNTQEGSEGCTDEPIDEESRPPKRHRTGTQDSSDETSVTRE